MYTATPGKTGLVAIRNEARKTIAETAQKPAQNQDIPKSKLSVVYECGYTCSCKSFHPEFSNKDREHVKNRTGKERRKCTHSHFGRRGRRAVDIFR